MHSENEEKKKETKITREKKKIVGEAFVVVLVAFVFYGTHFRAEQLSAEQMSPEQVSLQADQLSAEKLSVEQMSAEQMSAEQYVAFCGAIVGGAMCRR